jgi:hypothetical protein
MDFIRNQRVWDGDGNGESIIDIGAYEFGSEPMGICDLEQSLSRIPVTVFPNPFNSSTNINYTLHESANVSFKILDYLGRIVFEEYFQDLRAGEHQVKLKLNGQSQGLYIYHLTTGDNFASGKIVLFNAQ